jgi:hypothetical protein
LQAGQWSGWVGEALRGMPQEGQCRNEEDGCMGFRLVRAGGTDGIF